MPKYKLNVTLSAKGTVIVKADNIFEAKQAVKNGFGATVGTLHTSDVAVVDWTFDTHLEKTITKTRRQHGK